MKKGTGYFLFIVILFVPLFLSVRAFCQADYTFIKSWVIQGTVPDQTRWPSALAVDSKNNVYVCDDLNCRIQKYSANGDFILAWGSYGTGESQFIWPRGVAVDKNDNVYVSDIWGHKIEKFDANGNFLIRFADQTTITYPMGIDCDLNGNVYVNTDLCRVTVFDPSGNILTRIGSSYGDPNWPPEYQFVYPTYIAVNNSGEIFVAVWGDYGLGYPSRIKKFSPTYQFLTEWFLDAIAGVAIDPEGNVLASSVRDAEMGVYKYDPVGNLIQRIAQNGQDESQIWSPQDIVADSDGYVYITKVFESRIQKFAPPNVPYTFEGFFSPIENLPVVNQAKAGQTIPVKWRITDKNGLPISDPASFINITSYRVDCASFAGDPTNSVEEVAAGNSGLQYLGDGWWQFNWKTPKSYKGQCRVMKLTLDDKSEHTASFSFK